MHNRNIDVITMGCSKNLVDSEHLMGIFGASGFQVHHNPSELHNDVVVINTCGFIGDAKEESVNMILEAAKEKAEGRCSKLVVMGCLSERYRDELQAEIPEIDNIYGKFDWKMMATDFGAENKPHNYERTLSTPKHYAYIKISEGCNRTCSFCAIPKMTGKHKSRPKEDILNEVELLVSKGVKEFQIIAQDLSFYGADLYKSLELADLIRKISDIKGVEWIRLHYLYPAGFPYDILQVIKERDNVCNYIDIALQHISDNMLTKMHRHISKQETYALLDHIRKEVPGIHIRTTLLTGHPGETEEDYEELKQFVDKGRFERMGAFAYSKEDDTVAGTVYKDDVPDDVKQERLNTIMELQQPIAFEVNEQKVGQQLKVIVDREEDDCFIGRTEFDSPEVDPEVIIKKISDIQVGDMIKVNITGTSDFDLLGEKAN